MADLSKSNPGPEIESLSAAADSLPGRVYCSLLLIHPRVPRDPGAGSSVEV